MISNLRLKPMVFGLASFVPGVTRIFRREAGGAASARYCYSVWMRHLVKALAFKQTRLPDTIAELGPGDSLGVGLAALLTGASRYYACDFVKYANNLENLNVFDELVNLFSRRAEIPNDEEFPLLIPRLGSYGFPLEIIGEEQLHKSLSAERIQTIRASISTPSNQGGMITYMAPWYDSSVVKKHTVDMVFSQAVLEHVDELKQAYDVMRLWLKPSGFMTHTIDFKSHGLTKDWNGHWMQTELVWRLLRGRRPYMLNRQPCSIHLQMLRNAGFKILLEERFESHSGIGRSMLAKPFLKISAEDLSTSEAFILATPDSCHVGR